MKRSDLVLLFIVVLLLFSALFLLLSRPTVNWFIDEDAHRLFAQFLLITAVGSIGAFWIKQREQRREKAEREAERERLILSQKRQSLNEFYSNLVQINNGVKRIRRLLRAKSRVEGGTGRTIDHQDYETLMSDLVALQLELEGAMRECVVNADLFGEVAGEIKGRLEQAKEYLHMSVADYETGGHIRQSTPCLLNLPYNVHAFISTKDERKQRQWKNLYKKEFREPLRHVRKKIVKLSAVILSPKS